jgi:hypothetical protein
MASIGKIESTKFSEHIKKAKLVVSNMIIAFLAIPTLFYEAALETALAMELVDAEYEIQNVPYFGAL